jgi:hypothetical protein
VRSRKAGTGFSQKIELSRRAAQISVSIAMRRTGKKKTRCGFCMIRRRPRPGGGFRHVLAGMNGADFAH